MARCTGSADAAEARALYTELLEFIGGYPHLRLREVPAEIHTPEAGAIADRLFDGLDGKAAYTGWVAAYRIHMARARTAIRALRARRRAGDASARARRAEEAAALGAVVTCMIRMRRLSRPWAARRRAADPAGAGMPGSDARGADRPAGSVAAGRDIARDAAATGGARVALPGLGDAAFELPTTGLAALRPEPDALAAANTLAARAAWHWSQFLPAGRGIAAALGRAKLHTPRHGDAGLAAPPSYFVLRGAHGLRAALFEDGSALVGRTMAPASTDLVDRRMALLPAVFRFDRTGLAVEPLDLMAPARLRLAGTGTSARIEDTLQSEHRVAHSPRLRAHPPIAAILAELDRLREAFAQPLPVVAPPGAAGPPDAPEAPRFWPRHLPHLDLEEAPLARIRTRLARLAAWIELTHAGALHAVAVHLDVTPGAKLPGAAVAGAAVVPDCNSGAANTLVARASHRPGSQIIRFDPLALLGDPARLALPDAAGTARGLALQRAPRSARHQALPPGAARSQAPTPARITGNAGRTALEASQHTAFELRADFGVPAAHAWEISAI